MNTSNHAMAARWANYVILIVALIGGIYTYQSYNVITELLASSVEQLAPANAQRVTDVIESSFAPETDTSRVQAIIRSEQQHATFLHEGWLESVRLQASFLKIQLVLWGIVLVASLLGMRRNVKLMDTP